MKKTQGKLKQLLNIFLTFAKIGVFTFGGGYAMIPLIRKETVEKLGWISDDDLLSVIAIAEATPGPIAINAATFVGYKVCGFFGALCATLGVVVPSFTIIFVIALFLKHFQDIRVVRYAFFGIRAGVLALIFKALYTMYRQSPKNAVSYIIAALAFVAVAFLKVNVLLVIALSAAVGLVASLAAAKGGKI